MKTRASVFGHPVHMILVHFPLAFLAGSFFFDLAGTLLSHETLWQVAGYLLAVGLISGFVAVPPGVVDLIASVPAGTAPRVNGIRHAVASGAALGCFAVAWFLRGPASTEPALNAIVLEGVGTLVLGLAGLLGGSLVVKDLIGPHA